MKRIFTLIVILFAGYAAMAQCNPLFTYTQAASGNGNNLLNIGFTNTTVFTPTTGEQVYYSYDYGDGTSGSSDNHTYGSAGNYTVVLSMNVYNEDSVIDSSSNALVCSNTYSQNIAVATTSCATTASASVSSNTNTSVAVNFSANTPAGATGMTYAWNFGDGNTGSGITTSHTYTSSGNYTVTLTATNGSCTYTNTIYQFVNILDCSSLSANFTYTESYNTAYFTNTSTNANQGFSYIYETLSWNYGDGTTGDNSSHTYTTAGTYNVTLTTTWINDSTSNTDTCVHSITLPVTVGNPPNIIAGNISYSGTAPIDSGNFKVWLIQLNNNILSASDSMYASNHYQFNNEPNGTYMVKAQLLDNNNQPGVTGYIPTYATASLYWSSALNVTHAGGDDEGINITMQAGTVPSGPGFVAGNVLSGANKGTDAGIPVVGMLIYLRNASTNVLTYQYTDANGNYTFSNLPTGNYSTYPEAVGYATTPYDFTISTAQPTVNNIDYKEHTVSMTITPVTTTGISNVTANQMKLDVYPNPTNGTVNIQWQGADAQSAHVTITNVVGQKAFETDLNMDTSAGTEKLNVSALKDGMYLMTIKAGDVNYSQKLVIQH